MGHQCKGCNQDAVDDVIACQECRSTYHRACVNMHAVNDRQTRSAKEKWTCPECTAKHRRGGDNSNTPVRTKCSSQAPAAELDRPAPQPAPATMSAAEVASLTAAVRVFRQEFDALKVTMREFTASLEMCHGRVDDFNQKMSSMETRLVHLEKRDEEINTLKNTVTTMERELEFIQQNSMLNNIEIQGITEQQHENVYHTLFLIAQKVGYALDERDVNFVGRVGARRAGADVAPRPVIARFTRRKVRDELIKAHRTRRSLQLTTADVGVAGPPSRIYINDHLTKTNRSLYHQARTQAKLHEFKYVWISAGNVLTRKADNSAVHRIRSATDLETIFRSEAGPRAAPVKQGAPPAPRASSAHGE